MHSSFSQPERPSTVGLAASQRGRSLTFRARLLRTLGHQTKSRLTLILAVALFVGASAFVFVRSHAAGGSWPMPVGQSRFLSSSSGSGAGFSGINNGAVDPAVMDQPDILVVDNTTDNSVLRACTAAPNDCSLRGAMTKANISTADEVIEFDASVFGTLQTIVINDPNQEPLTIVNNSHMTINGGGKVRLSGNNQRRVFEINSGAVVTLDGLIITDGRSGFNSGGGIRNSGGSLTLTNSTVTGNLTGGSSGGAGIFNGSGTLNVTNSLVSGNSSAGVGGGIFNDGGTANITNSTVSGNSVNCLFGGGIANIGTLNVSNSMISGNSVINCSGSGGIYNSNGSTANVTNSTISGNSAASGAGGIENQGTFSLTNSTVSGNTAAFAGGIFNSIGRTLNLKSTTISRNTATSGTSGGIQANGPVNARNSIIAGNTASSVSPDFTGTLTSQGHNLIGNTTGTTITGDTTGNILSQNAQLAPLGNYGGGTLTHALLLTSPAINAGTSTDAPVADQRGANRVGQTDIGAFEVNALYTHVLPVGDVSISYTQTIVPNKLDFTYSVTAGSLPPGLMFDATTATVSIAGTPTTGGTYNFDITAERSGATSTTRYSIVINGAPAISNIADSSTDEDTATGNINFAIGDAETAAGSLTVSATSDNPTLVPNANITLGGTNGDRTININPALNQFGSALITVTVADARNLKATDTFILTVNPVNDAPTISAIAGASTNEDTASGTINFSVGDVETTAGSLTVSATSDNQTLVPNANISLGGSGSNRTISINPALNEFGTATIKVVVSDGVATAERTFVFTVNSINDAPSISDISSTSTNEDTTTGNINFTVGDVETAAGSLTVSATSDNGTLVPNANITLGGSGANRTVNITPVLNQVGSALIEVRVTDEGSLTATDTFTLTVIAVNDAPTISDIADTSTNEDTPSGNINFTIGDPDGPNVPLTVSATSDNETLVPNANISLGGSGSNRTISLNPALNEFGSTLITVVVTDAENLTATDTFRLTVNSVNDGPTISDIADQTFTYNGPTSAISFTVADVETPANSLTVTRSSSNTTLVPNANIVFGGQDANRTVTVTPAADQSGTTTIKIIVSDGSLTAEDTFLLTFTNTAPTISDIGNISVNEDTATTADISFTVADVETAAGSLTVSATSNNQTLVPDSNITLGGSGASRTISLAPSMNRSGTTTITVVVSDGNATGQDTFVLTVNPLNDIFVVDNTTDDGALSACTVAPNDCSLRGATKLASNDIIEFDATVFATLQTITLGGTQLTIENGGGTLTIKGGGKVRVTANNQSRVFQINSGVTATLDGLIITGGRSNSRGGGINNGGALSLTNSTISGNSAAGDFLIGGGGIANNGGTLSVANSTVSGNSTTTSGSGGGGISQDGGTLTVTNSTISGNSSLEFGGGIVKSGGTATIANSTISSNNAMFFGGGIYQGGGTVNLTNSTISGNSSSQGGGVRNATGAINARNSIIAGNTATSFGPDVYGFLTSQGYNLIGNTLHTLLFGNTTGNILDQNAQLGPLQNNGGATLTQAPLSNSPALNAGSNALALDPTNQPLSTDQRGAGFPRIFAGTVDMGAVESGGQAITVTTHAPANATYNTMFTVAATSGSGLPVTYSSGGICTNDGATFTMNSGAGTCIVKYDQSGDNEHSAAAQVTETVTAEKANQSINVSTSAPANASYNSSFTVVAAATSGLPVSFSSAGSCTNTGASFTMSAATGSCSVKYDQGGDSNYNTAAQVTQTVNAQKADQAIMFGALANKTFGDADFNVSATASSGLAVGFTASGNCTNAGNLVHLTGAGSCTVTAQQPGNADINAATDVAQSFSISKAAQTITFGALANKTFGDADFNISATATSGLGVSFVATGNCTIGGSTVHIAAAGSCTVTASQPGNADINAATDVAQSFSISKATQTITFGALANKTFGDVDFNVSATTTSGLGVSFVATGNCTIAGNTIHITAAGSCTITAQQAGNADFNSATDVAQSFSISKATQTITFGALANKTFGDADFNVSATASSGLGVGFAASGNCTVSGNAVHLTGAGSCTVTAQQPGNADINAAADVVQSFSISKANQTITFGALGNKTFGDADFNVSATTTSGLGVSFVATGNCTIAGNTVHITAAGSCTITASQPGDSNFNAAISVSQSFTIDKATSATTVTCAANVSYTGSALTPCSATVTGAGGLNQAVIVDYTNNTNAGTANASASFAGDSNHASSNDSKTFTIDKATSATTVMCPTNVSYTGSALTPCSATVTGAGGLSQAVTVSYTNNTNSGTANANASFAGDANHASSSDTKTFTIDKATSETTVTCPANATYTGSALTPCSATVTGAGGLSQAVTVDYTNNTNSGTANASVSFAGDGNHTSSSDSKNFTIDKATSAATVTCPTNATYTGSALTPCSATVTGAGGLSQTVTVDYTNNTNSGTANASASFAGDANHSASSSSKTFTIDKATSATTVTCPTNVSYTGSALTPCAANVTGAGGLSQAVTVAYTNNTNTGTANANASFAGDANHTASSDSKTFTIDKAVSATTLTCPTNVAYTGSALAPCSANVTGAGGLSQVVTVNYTNNTNTGIANANASFAGDANHTASSDSKTFTIDKATQTITFNPLANKTFGDPDFAVGATASSNLAVGFSAGGQCIVTGASVHLTGAGSCTITALQSGNSNYSAAANVPQSFNIAKATSTTMLASSANPSDLGQSVTFTARVNSSAGTPAGTVQFKLDGVNVGPSATLNGSGVATFATSSLTAGTRVITADYSGDTNFLTSSGTLSGGQVVNGQPSLSINDASITEGNSGTKTLNFTVTLSGPSSLPVTVNYATANGTATAPSDFTAVATTSLTFNPGDLTRTVSVTINGDTSFESDETLFVNLSSAVNATISDDQGLGTITNDDAQGGNIRFSADNYDVSEGAGFVTLTVNRSGDTTLPATVDYATDDTGAAANCGTLNSGLASSRCDFTAVLGTLSFAANETQKSLVIPINQDSFTEGPEVFRINLADPTGGAVLTTPSSPTITISDSVAPAANAIDDTATFVRQQYHDFLNREPDAAGLAFWIDNIDKCNDPARRPTGQSAAQCSEVQRINTSAAFFLSIEFLESGGMVRDFYVASLDRPLTNNMPDFVELMRDTQAVQRGIVVGQAGWQAALAANRSAFMNDFVMRAEFVGQYPATDTPVQFVDKMMAHAAVVLTSAERSAAIAEFGSATTAADPGARGRALLRVTQNAAFQARELKRSFVHMQYLGYLRRNPNAAPDANFNGYNFWLNKLVQFNGNYIDAEMVKAFISSAEYRGRFGP